MKYISPVPQSVRLADPVFAPRQEENRDATIPASLKFCEETHRIDALRLKWKRGDDWTPHVYWDSDVAKVRSFMRWRAWTTTLGCTGSRSTLRRSSVLRRRRGCRAAQSQSAARRACGSALATPSTRPPHRAPAAGLSWQSRMPSGRTGVPPKCASGFASAFHADFVCANLSPSATCGAGVHATHRGTVMNARQAHPSRL